MKKESNTRRSGVLLPVFSLPSRTGIGGFSHQAESFLDFLAEAGQAFWQVLPLEPATEDHSPYQPFSCFAHEPAFIDPEILREEGLLTAEDLRQYREALQDARHIEEAGRIDYDRVLPALAQLRRTAFGRFRDLLRDGSAGPAGDLFNAYRKEQAWWLHDYALFVVLKERFGGAPWADWPEEYKRRNPEALAAVQRENAHEIGYLAWEQFEAAREWERIHAYAQSKGIRIIGDLPIYAALESADCWAHPELFELDEDLRPRTVSGCPPDAFAPQGQFWNNPLYRWEEAKEKVFFWWFQRFRRKFEDFDALRIDHFRGFESYFSIPADGTPADGHWVKGPGIEFFNALDRAVGHRGMIAEDLGYLTPEVVELRTETGFPGMKILQFAFDSDMNNPYLPHNYGIRTVVYPGTHDNDTSRGWYQNAPQQRRDFACWYLGQYFRDRQSHPAVQSLPPEQRARWLAGNVPEEEFADAFVLLAEMSPAETCIVGAWDLLGLGSEARINVPSVAGGNWNWQLGMGSLTPALASRLRTLAADCSRLE